jgi:hypothetical protein
MAPPSARVASPEYHQGRTDHRLLSAPIRKDIRPVTEQEVQKASFKAATNGIRGTSPQRRKAGNVKIDARQGERTASGKPYSSRSMMRTQRLRSAVIAPTTWSSKSPGIPRVRRISRTSSRSPSGWQSFLLRAQIARAIRDGLQDALAKP